MICNISLSLYCSRSHRSDERAKRDVLLQREQQCCCTRAYIYIYINNNNNNKQTSFRVGKRWNKCYTKFSTSTTQTTMIRSVIWPASRECAVHATLSHSCPSSRPSTTALCACSRRYIRFLTRLNKQLSSLPPRSSQNTFEQSETMSLAQCKHAKIRM